MRSILKNFLGVIDLLMVPFVVPCAWFLKKVRQAGLHRLPLCRKVLLAVGVLPVTDHYYEPQIDMRNLKKEADEVRDIPGIDWNIDKQLMLLDSFTATSELERYNVHSDDELQFSFENSAFNSGDAEFWYQLIRLKKPSRIFEIGSGNSTLIAIDAIKQNMAEDPGYKCKHVCIEPYEMAWLEKTGVEVLREKVEDVDVNFFRELEENDILFIDSSHIIRPEGDVLFEYLELLPQINRGVIVHVHDIFSPRNYLKEWLVSEIKLWNEQYLLEAFLTENSNWEIIGALNYLKHDHFDKMKSVCPFLTEDREPGSFYMCKIK